MNNLTQGLGGNATIIRLFKLLKNSTLRFLLLLSAMFMVGNVYAINITECSQYSGSYTCFAANPATVEAWYYVPSGSSTHYDTEQAAIQSLSDNYFQCPNGGTTTTRTYPDGSSQTRTCSVEVASWEAPLYIVKPREDLCASHSNWTQVWSTKSIYSPPIIPDNQCKWIKVRSVTTYSNSSYVNDTTSYYSIYRSRNVLSPTCPSGSQMVTRFTGQESYPYMCATPKPIIKGSTCSATANPCSITTGNKFKPQLDWKAPIGQLQFKRMYNSLASVAANTLPMGKAWTHNYNLKLTITPNQVILTRADGRDVYASKAYTDTTIAGANGWFINRDLGLKLNQLADSSWELMNIKTNVKESYDMNGRLAKISYPNNQFVSLTYPATIAATATTPAIVSFSATQVTDNFGQTLKFAYNSAGLLTSVTLPNNKVINYTFDAQNRLSTVTRPGYGTKTYLYSENTTIAPSGNLNLLTGILDEKGIRFESYAYNAQDQGIHTEKAGGVEVYNLTHTDSATTVTDPHGLSKVYNKTMVSGAPYVTATSINGTAETNNVYDAAGNITSATQYGRTTTYKYDLTRNLETSRTEAAGTAQARTITTVWDNVLPVPLKISETGRETTFTYDTNGNILSKTVKDTASNISRTWNYTYNTVGQKLTETNPAGEKTSYTYNTAGQLLTVTNALGHVTTYSGYNLLGQPTIITSPTGQKTTYTYDDAGRVTKQVVNVLNPTFETTYTESANTITWPQWIVNLVNSWCKALGISSPFSTTGTTATPVGTGNIVYAASYNATTSYVYDAIGQLTQVTLPDGEVLTYSYDDAHRLIGAKDNLGNTTSYTLNGAGDITNTTIADPSGNIKLKTKQVFDTLGRVQQEVGNNNQLSTYSYDNFDNLVKSTDALNRNNSSTYDALNHKISDVDALGQTVKYSYNALDQLLSVTDARNNVTSYSPNAFGEVVSETNPDTGTTTRSYNNGRLVSMLDSLGIPHAYTYDTAGRVLTRTDGTGNTLLNTVYGYDAGTYGKGALTLLKNDASEIHYNRNSNGQVVEKTIAVKNNVPLRVQYQYTAGDKVTNLIYPSGLAVFYNYLNQRGTLTRIATRYGYILLNITYGPAGISGWDWGATDTNPTLDKVALTYDLDGRLNNISSTGVLGRAYAFDKGNRITTIADILAGIGTQSFTHDATDRLTKQTLVDKTLSYTYDANSNRTSKTQVQGTSNTVSNYVMLTSNNRLSSNTYLATGQTVNDGVRNYTYDVAGRTTAITKGTTTLYNTYNALGQRVRKDVGATSVYFVYDEQGHLLGEYDKNRVMQREYIWMGDRIVGMTSIDRPNVLLRVHTDHLGTPRAVSEGTGSARKVLWRWDGDAFGDVLPNEDADKDGKKFVMPLRMQGQYFDAEVGTFYNYFRDYDPAMGRYVESDQIGLQGGMNTYGYVGGSVLGAVDPDGRVAIFLPELVAGAAALSAGVACYATNCGSALGAAADAANNMWDKMFPPNASGMAGAAPYPAPYSHREENDALGTPKWSDCAALKAAIAILDAQIAWRKLDLNPRERGSKTYVDHQKRIRILRAVRDSLQREYDLRCNNQCSAA